ncbi:Protein FMP52 [Diplonema papillatum]|nr:Protein FMP52 [Diplonema papillatum]
MSAEQDAAPAKKAIVLGGTGMIGKELVRELCESGDFAAVRVLVRKERSPDYYGLPATSPRLDQRVLDHDAMDPAAFEGGFTHGFSALGTTRKDAGSAEAFKKVDFDYNLAAAKLMKQTGVGHYQLVSSQGASASSWLLYPQTKGKLENEATALGFAHTTIYRPGLLAGRGGGRWVESCANTVVPNHFRCHVRTVARAMLFKTRADEAKLPAVEFVENAAIKKFVETVGGKDALFDKVV